MSETRREKRARVADLRLAKEQCVKRFAGIPVVIEYPNGSIRKGKDTQGRPWARRMCADYGFVPGTRAAGDGEPLDVYLGPNPEAPQVWIVEQLKEDGTFDESKALLGFQDEHAARATYLAHYPAGWDSRIGRLWPIPVEVLRRQVGAVRQEAKDAVEAAPALTDFVNGKRIHLPEWTRTGLMVALDRETKGYRSTQHGKKRETGSGT